MLGPMEIAVITGVILLIFGPRQIPKMGKALGETVREFRGIRRTLDEDVDLDE